MLDSIRLLNTLKYEDEITSLHSRRVAALSIAVAREMALKKEEIKNLFWGTILHDLGKIFINPSIINKPGRLTDKEYRKINKHITFGAKITKSLANQKIVEIIEHHHDYFDGSRLEQRLKGHAIPLGARICALADSFDAIISERPYRSALSVENGIHEIENCAATQFDPAIVKIFITPAITNKIKVILPKA